MNSSMHDTPDVRVHPPVIYLAAFLVGIGLHHWWPIRILPGRSDIVLGVGMIVAGIAIMPPVLVRFRRAGTAFNPHKHATVAREGLRPSIMVKF